MKQLPPNSYNPPDGVMWFMRGQCTQCGKLTPPIFSEPDGDHLTVLSRLRDMLTPVGWYMDVYRLFSGPKPGIKVICRCPVCEKELNELTNKGESSTVTVVTNMDGSTEQASKGAE